MMLLTAIMMGFVNPGETINLNTLFKNNSAQSLNNITISMECEIHIINGNRFIKGYLSFECSQISQA
jgi:hypothetical protein